MRPYDAWTDEEAIICAWAMFISIVAAFAWYLEVLNGSFQ